MKIGSLFSGYGGLDMGVQSVLGGDVIWNIEYDEAPGKILEHHWPGVPNYGDVTTVDWSTVPGIDVLTAGYPCQPFSIAGKRKGANDERHLWPYVLDAIRQLRPRYVVLENVRGHLTLGFDRVLGDLAEAGYDAEWVCLPAAAAGAPHRRERIFILAYPADLGHEWPGSTRDWGDGLADGRHDAPDAPSAGCTGGGVRGRYQADGEVLDVESEYASAGAWGKYGIAVRRWEVTLGRLAPAPTVPDGRDGKSRLNPRFSEWMMGLPDGHVTDVGLTRAQQLKALGNGVVPQQAALALCVLLSHSRSSTAETSAP